MRRSVLCAAGAAVLFCSPLTYGQWSPKPKFDGTWQLSPEKSELKAWKPNSVVLTVEQPLQGEIHVIEVAKEGGGDKKSEFKCNTTGKDCGPAGERTSTLSLYYNGPKLVSIERIGKDSDTVLKRVYSLSEDGNTLTLEVSQIVPPRSEVDKLVFTRQGEPPPAETAAAPVKE
jgi:hypothetical protein